MLKKNCYGKPMYLRVNEINVDTTYQRDLDEGHSKKIAKKFDRKACGAIMVARRKDGTYWVIDGGHRLDAAKKAGEEFILCLVYNVENAGEEAYLFVSLNSGRKNVHPVDRFRAALVSGEQLETAIFSFLKKKGLSVARGKHENNIGFASRLISTWNSNGEAAMSAILYQLSIREGEPLSCDVHEGLWYMLKNGQKINQRDIEKLRRAGIFSIEKTIKMMAVTMGKKRTAQLDAAGIVSIINKGRSKENKLKSPFEY
jgi:hypothetical protein